MNHSFSNFSLCSRADTLSFSNVGSFSSMAHWSWKFAMNFEHVELFSRQDSLLMEIDEIEMRSGFYLAVVVVVH